MINNYTVPTQDRDNHASFVTTNQMMPRVAHYTAPEFTESSINPYYAPHITTAPVVKSHHPISVFTMPIGAIPQQQQQQQQQQQITSLDLSTTNMMMNAMEIDDYFTNNNNNNTLLNMYSPSSTTTNNSSNMMMDHTMSPTSPQPLDTLSSFHSQLMMTDNTMLPIPTVSHPMPFHAQDDQHMMYHHHFHQPQPYTNHRRTLPRRHTVSTPYTTVNTPIKPNKPEPATKSRKSSLKAKRHRSLGKIDIYASTTPPPIPDLLSTKLELWTHEQLLERVMELESERQVAQHSKDESGHLNTMANKVRSASQTDTELEEEEEEEEEEEVQTCKWENCSIEFKTLDELINHVKTDHIGSGKANYYCCWKDCPRNQKPFTKRHKMHNHLRTHTGERPFVCQEPDCGKKFSRPDSLTTHAKIHSNIRPYLCKNPDCGKAYYHLRSLRKHERTHLPASSPPPLPTVVHATTSHPDEYMVVQPSEEEVFSDWGISAQAAVFDVMNRDTFL